MHLKRIAVAVTLVACIGLGYGTMSTLADTAESNVAPRCTDAIADAGGICQGEPLPACQTEDSDDCYWDAATMGNGEGRSFIVESGVVTYTDSVN
jgi:hypothetical protein